MPLISSTIGDSALSRVPNLEPGLEPNPVIISNVHENQWTPAALEKAGSNLKALNGIVRCRPVNVSFENISCSVSTIKDDIEILHGLSGEFRSGELACILGPSGAGKSTLLNVLAGYVSKGVSGRVKVNGHPRNVKLFKKHSRYILQDDMLQQQLTILESMQVAADLKLGINVSYKKELIEEILRTLGLWDHRDTMTEHLSGGQNKRLSVALELISNPPVLFLDEPTTGLDIVSIRHLVVLLRNISRQSRTVVCTIHQPSALLFELFDRVYVIGKGRCCYQGSPNLLVPYLAELGYVCPTTHNPADFVLETMFSNEESTDLMVDHCGNGKLCRETDCKELVDGSKAALYSDVSVRNIFCDIPETNLPQLQDVAFPTSPFSQFKILSKRIFKQKLRNSTALWIQLSHHILSGLLIGCVFLNVGDDGSQPIVNFKFCLTSVVFFMYTYVMVPVLLFPTEMRLLRREYFNKWYSLKAYYTAISLSILPTMIILGFLFNIITYTMSGQLLELERFICYFFMTILIGFCSQGLGLMIGSTCDVTDGSIVAPAVASPLLALCCYGMGFGRTIETFMRVLMGLSYIRYGLTGLSLSLFEDRDHLNCPDVFCPYDNPQIILREVGMAGAVYRNQVICIFGFIIVHWCSAFLFLRYNLTSNLPKCIMYIRKIFRYMCEFGRYIIKLCTSPRQ